MTDHDDDVDPEGDADFEDRRAAQRERDNERKAQGYYERRLEREGNR